MISNEKYGLLNPYLFNYEDPLTSKLQFDNNQDKKEEES